VITAEDLLAGPRGRRLCLELALRVQRAGDPAAWRLGTLLDRQADARAVATAIAALALWAPTAEDVVDALERTAESALWWRPPDAEDVLLARPPLRAPLGRLAAWAVSADAVRRLGASDGRRFLVAPETGAGPDGAGMRAVPSAAAALRDWADELRAEAARRAPRDVSGTWWTTPPWPVEPTTAAPFPEYGPLALWAVEDSFGWQRAVVSAVSAPVSGTARGSDRVWTVDGPDDWAELCRRWPIDVGTTTRRRDWGEATGRDGGWVVPDWSQVARAHDVVHLTVRGWLRTSGVAVAVDDDRASVVAGWTPDSAYRFADPAPVDDTAVWTRPDSTGVWQRERP